MSLEAVRALSGVDLSRNISFSKKPDEPVIQDNQRSYKRQENNIDDNNSDYGRVEIHYHGTLAQKLNWDFDKLDEYAEEAALHSLTNIRSSDEMSGTRQYTSLGDTAIWQRFGNPLEMFAERNESQYSRSEREPDSWIIDAYIKDQELSDSVRQQETGIFEETYVGELNKEVKELLKDSLFTEKTRLAKTAAVVKGLAAMPGVMKATAVAYAGVMGYFAIGKLQEAYNSIVSINPLIVDGEQAAAEDLVSGIILGVWGAATSGLMYKYLSDIPMDIFVSYVIPEEYDRSVTRHIKDGVRGWFYLKTKGKNLVSLKSDESPNIVREP